jgi:hypothetical protein
MPIKVTCSNCGGVLHAPDDAGGKRGRCPTCGNILPIPAAAGGGGGAELPEPPPAPPGQRPPSFADFAVGPQVGPPPSAEIGRPGKSSMPFNTGGSPDPAPPQRAKPPGEPVDARRASDPFARPGSPAPMPKTARADAPAAAPTEGTVKAWKRCRGGLGLVQAGNFLLFIPVVLLPVYYVVSAVKPDLIPNQPAGFMGIPGVDLATAVPLLGGGGVALLALLLNLFGRLSFAGAPKRSAVGGPAMLSALAALLALCGAIAVVFPNVAMMISGGSPFPVEGKLLFDVPGLEGLIQRLGITFGLGALAVGEFWFSSAVGRVGSALADGKPAARSTRYQLLLGLVAIGLVGTAAVIPGEWFGLWAPGVESRSQGVEFPQYKGRVKTANNPAHEFGNQTNELVAGQWELHVGKQVENAGSLAPVIPPAAFAVVGLLVWLMHLRMVGAARGAVAGWLDAHGNAA